MQCLSKVVHLALTISSILKIEIYMKKYLPAIILGIVLLAIGGYIFLNTNNSLVTNPGNTQVTKKDLFASIKDAMSKSLSLKCEYQGTEGKTITYIKGDKIRIILEEVKNNTKSGNAIFKESKMWSWNEGEKEGIVMKIGEDNSNNQGSSNQANKDEIIAELEKFKDKCSTVVISDDMFIPPDTVVFTDLSKLQEEMMNNLNKNVIGE